MLIEIPGGEGRPPSHLSCRLELPAAGSGAASADAALLYCHGFASSQEGAKAEFFRAKALEAGLAFCSFDFQGHGASGGAMFDLTLDRNLEDLGRVHDALLARGLSRIVLLGSSMGAGSGLYFAARHPGSIVAAVHIAPALEMDRGLLRLVGERKALLWEEQGSILFEHELGAYDLSWGIIENLRGYDPGELHSGYRVPTLLIQGQRDSSVDWRSVAEFAERAGGEIELHLFADGDHRLVDRLPALWQLTEGFLRRHGVLPGGESATLAAS
jgi:pimeloyl-ACP methyl ester carboxylesterase